MDHFLIAFEAETGVTDDKSVIILFYFASKCTNTREKEL